MIKKLIKCFYFREEKKKKESFLNPFATATYLTWGERLEKHVVVSLAMGK